MYAIRKIFLPKSNQKTVTSKCFQNFIPDSFPTDLSMVPWHLIEQEYKPDNAWDIWQHMFLDIADYHAPLKKKRTRRVASPWTTPELKKLIYQMRQTQKHSLEVPNRWQLDVLQTHKVNCEIKNAQMNYYNAFFKDNRRNINNTWKGINRLIGNESKSNKITQLDTGDSVSTDAMEIGTILKTHFSKIAPCLASEIQSRSSNFTDYVTPAEQIFKLAEVSCQEVFNSFRKKRVIKPARLLKEASPIVIRSLTFVLNLSITTGIFPNAWKRARVSPVFKKDLQTDPNNNRPISVLPVVSKLIERVVFKQLYEYLNDNNLLTESQSGFRPMFSTKTALLEITNEWPWNIDNNLLNGVIFLDLKRALGTMDHAILMGTLKLHGVSSQSPNWFRSYLSDRKQQTFIDGAQSDFSNITCGISQGSISGHLLFTIYINDLPSCNFVFKIQNVCR